MQATAPAARDPPPNTLAGPDSLPTPRYALLSASSGLGARPTNDPLPVKAHSLRRRVGTIRAAGYTQ